MSKKMTRLVVALLLAVTFTAGAAQAAPWAHGDTETSFFASLWGWVASWIEPSEPTTVWMEGCGMDPNGGGCHNGSTTNPADPNG